MAVREANSRPWGYESMAPATDFHHKPHKQHKPERIAPNQRVYALYELYALYEVWQKSGNEFTPRSDEPYPSAQPCPKKVPRVFIHRLAEASGNIEAIQL